jgi:hypothetical protein
MKKSELLQIIKEEIKAVINENTPRYKKGDKLNYKGINYTVVSDSGYVVDVVDGKGNKSTYNYNQLNQGVFRKPVNEEGEMGEYRFKVKYWENNSSNKNYYTTGPILATSEEKALKIAQEKAEDFAKDELVKIDSIELIKKTELVK